MVSDSTLQIPSRNFSFVKFWRSIKENVHNYLKSLLKYSFSQSVSSYIVSTKTCGNRLNAEAHRRIQLSPIKPDIKKICKKRK